MTAKVMALNQTTKEITSHRQGLKPLSRWCEENGITRATAWRWRRDGLIATINIYGRQYITRDAEEQFLLRATSGEFHRDPHAPVAAKETEVDV